MGIVTQSHRLPEDSLVKSEKKAVRSEHPHPGVFKYLRYLILLYKSEFFCRFYKVGKKNDCIPRRTCQVAHFSMGSYVFVWLKFGISFIETVCNRPLGMESEVITHAQLSASSEWGGNVSHSPRQGRLNYIGHSNYASAWCPDRTDNNPWLQVDFGNCTIVTGIATQGRNGWGYWWVTKYQLNYSDNGVAFKFYMEPPSISARVSFYEFYFYHCYHCHHEKSLCLTVNRTNVDFD